MAITNPTRAITENRTVTEALRESPVKRLSLRHNLLWTLGGNAVYMACQWGMLVAMVKLGRPEMAGQYALALAITAPVFLLTNLRLRAVLATDAAREFEPSDYARVRLLSTLPAYLVVALWLLIGGYNAAASVIVLLIATSKALESGSDLVYGRWQQLERMDLIALSMMVRGVASLAVFCAVLISTRSAADACLSLAASWALCLLAFDLPRSGKWAARRHDSAAWRRLAWKTMPLGVGAMLISLSANVPRLFIERTLGTRELGIFAALSYVAMAGNLVVAALAESSCARLGVSFLEGNAAFRTLLLKLCAIGFAIGLFGMAVAAVGGKPLLTLVYRPEYAGHAGLLVRLMGVAALTNVASFLHYGMIAARCFRGQMAVLWGVTAIAVAGCFLLIPRYGLDGAAIAMGAAMLAQLTASAGVISRALSGRKAVYA